MTARLLRWPVFATVAALSVAGCSLDPAALPVPGDLTTGPGYRIRIEMSSALNLPGRAKVIANGTRVGTVERVEVSEPPDHGTGHVVIHARIDAGARLPAGTTAALRQNTLLGDMHVALTYPSDDTRTPLADGATIALSRTEPPMQIEDTLAGLATFFQGGTVQRLQDIVDRLNTILPADPRESARLAQTVGADTMDLAHHLDEVDQLLDGLTADSKVMRDQSPTLAKLLTGPEVEHVTDAVTSIVGVIGVLGSMGRVAHALQWLAPIAAAGDAAAEAFLPLVFTDRPLDLDAPSNLNMLVGWVRDRLIPYVEHGPKVDIRHLTVTPSGGRISTEDQVARIIDTLRMMGAVR